MEKKVILSVLLLFLSACSYFDEAEEILQGKRENVFEFDDDIILKSNQKIQIDKSLLVESWSQQFQNERNHLFHFKSKPKIKLKKK